MKNILGLFFVLFFFIFMGCASYAPILSNADEVNTEMAYIFGEFGLIQTSGDMAIALVLEGPKKYTIRLIKDTNNIYPIEVKPGKYKITSILYLYAFGEIGGKDKIKSSNPELTQEFEIKSGDLCYIGDFVGSITSSSRGYNMMLADVKNDFKMTSHILKERYPNLSSLKIKSIYSE